MFDPFGFFLIKSEKDRHLPFAELIFSFAFWEKAKAVIVMGWLISPALNTLPGTTTVTFFSVYLLRRLKFTATRFFLGAARRSAMSRQISTLFSLLCFLKNRMSSMSSGFVVLAFFTLFHLDLAFELFQLLVQDFDSFCHYSLRRERTRRF